MYLTGQLANSLQEARSPNSQSPLLSPLHCWSSDCLSGQQARRVCIFTSFLWLACSCLSVFQPKKLALELDEEDGEPGGSELKAALPGSFWLVSVTSWKTEGWLLFSPTCHSPLFSLSWQMCPGSWKHQGDPLSLPGVGEETHRDH